MSRYRVLIVGAGNIGAMFDSPGSRNILTHGHAFSSHPSFELVGFVDRDMKKAKDAAVKWGGRYFRTVKEAEAERPDVVCVAVPDREHHGVLLEVLELRPKLVFAEKPLARNMVEAGSIRDGYSRSNTPLCMNFTRRYVSELRAIRQRIVDGEFGKFVYGTGYYGKGVLHNGSHMIDILRYLLGEFSRVIPIGSIKDYEDDPSITATLLTQAGMPFNLVAIDSSLFSIFEADLVFQKKRLRFEDSFITVTEYDLMDNDEYKGYRELVKVRTYVTDQKRALYNAAQNISDHLDGKCALFSTIEDGLVAMQLCSILSETGANE